MRITVGVTGATGVEMSYSLLKTLKMVENCEVHLVVSDSAKINWKLETNKDLTELLDLADTVHDAHNMAASISSGSFITDGIIVMPCSVKSLAGIVSGYSDNLILRAVDVCMKERRKVVLVPREMPLGTLHLRNMYEASKLGCVVIPPMLTFYNNPLTLQEQVNHIVGKVLMQFGISTKDFKPWQSVD